MREHIETMSSDGPTPPPCDPDILRNGTVVAHLDGPPNAVERLVREVAQFADARVDWSYTGGVAVVRHLGDDASRARALLGISNLAGQAANVTVLSRRSV